jgi:prolipoprotein diacylglyceryltransferase
MKLSLGFNALMAELILYLVAGVLFGGHLGYVRFYNSQYYLHHPAAIVEPVGPVLRVP